MHNDWFDIHCRRCDRLACFLDRVAEQYPTYHARPVPPFGDPRAHLLVVGLAPGMHGANASGRPFTGDHAGILLYETLYRFGFSSGPTSVAAADGLRLHDCRITNAVKCLPPQNKPLGAEVSRCNGYLSSELAAMAPGSVVLALGSVAHQAVVRALGLKPRALPFGHGREYALPGDRTLLDSYHCSRYNTQTRRLTTDMFRAVVGRARVLISP
jgi:uracil-DNA glycosylase family 4